MASLAGHLRRFSEYAGVLGLPQTMRLYAGRATKAREITLRCQGVPWDLVCRPAVSDYHALRHIFVDHDSDVAVDIPPKLIVDGGANVGYASVLFANKYPGAKIIAVEPDAENARMVKRNCAGLSNVQLVEGGIWGRNCRLRISNPYCDPCGFQVTETDEEESSMQAYTIADLLAMSGESFIDILKLDIEGAEVQVFSATDLGWLDRTRVLCIETHGAEAEQIVRDALKNRDFSCDVKGEKLIFRNTRLNSAPASPPGQ